MLNHKNRKLLWVVIASLGLNGCFSNHYYVLSTASQPMETYTTKSMSIGVEKVTVPEYLFKREIAVAKTSSEVIFLSDGTWAEDLDAGLTLRLISFLQKKFNQPNVHQYPWGTDTQPSKKIKVAISRFIAQGDTVYLDATWEVENMKTGYKKARLFQTTVTMDKSNTSSIVEAMDSAFSLLEAEIARGVY